MPEEESYDGYMQLENGVGMLRLLLNEFEESFANLEGDERNVEISIATGKLAYPYLKHMVEKLQMKFPNVKVHLYWIHNEFFGEKITVAGLITGQDLMAQLKGQELGSKLLLPCNMLRDGEEVFLDDVSLDDVKESLQVEIDIVKSSGWDLVERILNK